jgi:hypothetical protein
MAAASLTEFDRETWAAACDSFFEHTEREARLIHACRALASLVAENDDFPAIWAKAVQS